MPKKKKQELNSVFIAIIVLVIISIFGFMVNSMMADSQKQQTLENQRLYNLQQQQEKAQQEKQAQEDAEKANTKKSLDACITDVNNAITTALAAPALQDATSESAASYRQNVLQLQQSHIAECQAKYGS